jgi:hypothetical protein
MINALALSNTSVFMPEVSCGDGRNSPALNPPDSRASINRRALSASISSRWPRSTSVSPNLQAVKIPTAVAMTSNDTIAGHRVDMETARRPV